MISARSGMDLSMGVLGPLEHAGKKSTSQGWQGGAQSTGSPQRGASFLAVAGLDSNSHSVAGFQINLLSSTL